MQMKPEEFFQALYQGAGGLLIINKPNQTIVYRIGYNKSNQLVKKIYKSFCPNVFQTGKSRQQLFQDLKKQNVIDMKLVQSSSIKIFLLNKTNCYEEYQCFKNLFILVKILDQKDGLSLLINKNLQPLKDSQSGVQLRKSNFQTRNVTFYEGLKQLLEKTTLGAGSGATIMTVLNAGTKYVIYKMGFTTGGVAANSLAAAIHASIGNVAAGSTFATLQSAGALGAGILGSAIVPVAIVSGAAGGVYTVYKLREGIAQLANQSAQKTKEISNKVFDYFKDMKKSKL